MESDRRLVETLVRPHVVYRGKSVNFRVDDVRLSNGRRAIREFMDHPGAVGVVPLLDAKTVVLVRQYRHPVAEVTLELPAGKLDRGEKALSCARRELAEETGMRARKIMPLIRYWPTPAFANEVLHLFVATGLVPGNSAPDDDELLDVEIMPFAKALRLVRSGVIRDSKTVVGLLACALWRTRLNPAQYTKLRIP